MSAELRVSIGELGFAVGVVSTLERGLELVSAQCGVTELVEAKAVLAASGHSLFARELARPGAREVTLAPPLRAAAEILADAEWMLRCSRAIGDRVEHLLVHLAPTGALADLPDGEYVHRVGPLGGAGAVIERACSFFELPPRDEPPPILVERSVIERVGALPPGADLAAELGARGVPEELAAPFAADLAAPRWRGTATLVSAPRGQAPASRELLVLLGGARTWLLAATDAGPVALGAASRQRLAATLKAFLRTLDSTARKFDRAGELDAP